MLGKQKIAGETGANAREEVSLRSAEDPDSVRHMISIFRWG